MAISTYELLIPKRITVPKVDKDLEHDSILPEYCPDIARIIKIDCTPFAENCSVSDGQATVTGKAVYDLLYETDYKNRLRCCNFTQDFSISAPVPKNETNNPSAFCKVACEKISCKLFGPRRVVIRASLCADFDIECENPCKAISVEEDGETFFRKKTVGFDGRCSAFESSYNFSELLPLAQSEKCIGEIVCGYVTLQSPQVNIQNGVAELKTTATVHTICEEESNEGKYFASAKTLPINIEYPNDSIAEYKSIRTELVPFDTAFSVELDQYGESRVIKTTFSVRLNIHISEPKAYTVAEDMFEKNHDSVPIETSVFLPRTISERATGFSVDAKLSPMTPKPEAILDTTVRDYGTTVEIAEEGAVLSGNFIVTLLADTQEGVYSFDHSVPFRQPLPSDVLKDTAKISVSAGPFDTVATLHSDGSVSLHIISDAQIFLRAENEESFLSDVTKRKPRAADTEDSMLIYCFPKKDEDLWGVAKLYRASPESILKSNPERFDEQGMLTDSSKPILINI